MIVTITPIEDHVQYNVNGHIVYQYDGVYWCSNTELSKTEYKAFEVYRKLIIRNPRFKKHPKSTYKT